MNNPSRWALGHFIVTFVVSVIGLAPADEVAKRNATDAENRNRGSGSGFRFRLRLRLPVPDPVSVICNICYGAALVTCP